MNDQRLVNRLENYWNLIRRGKPMPEIAMFNSAPIEDLWHKCMKIEIQPTQDGTSFTYRYLGSSITTMFGRDITNTTVNMKMTKYPLGVIVRAMDNCMIMKTFVIDENQFVNEKGKIVKYRSCVMPFGNETKGITHLIMGISDRQF